MPNIQHYCSGGEYTRLINATTMAVVCWYPIGGYEGGGRQSGYGYGGIDKPKCYIVMDPKLYVATDRSWNSTANMIWE